MGFLGEWGLVVLGAALGGLALVYGGSAMPRSGAKPEKPTLLGWIVLVYGLITLALCLMVTGGGSERLAWAYGGGAATLIAGIGAVAKGDRHWPTWTGLVVGGVPALFWLLFLIGEVVSPHA